MEPEPGTDDHALHFLANEGYLPISLSDHPALLAAYASLFEKASSFFAQPEDSPQKSKFLAKSGPAASEEGYSKIHNEKSIATIKIADNCPDELLDATKTAWKLSGDFVKAVSTAIAKTLYLDPAAFSTLVDPCLELPQSERTPTLLRMFRYDRPTGPDPIVNAERHKDLGLLSLVIGHSPGLHVLSPSSNQWIPIEEEFVLPPGTKTRSRGLTATLLGGETLNFLTRGVYKAGLHGVVCMPTPSGSDDNKNTHREERFRYSIVFTLRPAVAPVYTKHFESDIVGTFADEERVDGTSSAELFGKIKKTHYNVNVAPEIREKQKQGQGKAKENLPATG